MTFLGFIFGGIFLLVGLILVFVAISQRKKAQAAEAWPVAPGLILSSGLANHNSYDSDSGSTTNYEPQVQYQYTIMGQPYTGNQLSFGTAQYDYNTAAKKIAPYPQGTPVTVHYDPSNPVNAVLETKAAAGGILLAIGILFIVIGLAAIIFLPMMMG